jgi:hypothetical protein
MHLGNNQRMPPPGNGLLHRVTERAELKSPDSKGQEIEDAMMENDGDHLWGL